MIDSRLSSLAVALAATSLLIATDALAQSCANPQRAFVGSIVTGSTCGTNALPALNHGTIPTPGDDKVFRVSGTYGVDGVVVTGQPADTFVFVCSGCGPNAECVASAIGDENGLASVSYPHDGRDYYVIVDGAEPGCGDFQLQVSGPLKASP